MDIKKAKEIVEENCLEFAQKNIVMRGLQILAKYENDVIPEFDHDIMWASDFKTTVLQMSEEEVLQMAKLGWFYDEDNKSWAHF